MEKVRKIQGITEPFWLTLSEDQKLLWKYSSRIVALGCAFFVIKTGNPYIDWVLATIAAIFLLIVIETQRSYTKLSPKLRKRSIRAAIFLGSWGVTVLGILIFSQIGLFSAASVLLAQVMPTINKGIDPLLEFLVVSAFLIAIPIAIIRFFREQHIEYIIYTLPHTQLKKALLLKEPKATSLYSFAVIEISVLVVCCVYVSTFSLFLAVLMSLLKY
jgi:hypothetical protein